ncbi:MAG: nicotinamide-nucleotide amidohydrolase family protein, partial [bacterium]
EAEKLIEPMDLKIRERLGDAVYGIDEMKLEDVVVSLLREHRQTLSVGESCSGGLLSHRITNIPGASNVFLGGVVAYSNELKMRELGVPESVLIEHGAVCPEVATLMAQGVAKLTGSNWGIGITGIAGPTGGTETKPVGLVYIAIANGASSFVEENKFIGQRETVKERSAHRALELLHKGILRGGCESL